MHHLPIELLEHRARQEHGRPRSIAFCGLMSLWQIFREWRNAIPDLSKSLHSHPPAIKT